MQGQIVDHIIQISGHGTAGCFYMAAAAEILGDFADIQTAVGTHTDFEFMNARLIHKNGALHAFCNPQLIHDSV